MARTITKRIGSTVEIRYPDVPLWSKDQARLVLTEKARLFFELALQAIAGHVSDAAPVGVSGNLAQSFGASPATSTGGIVVTGSSIENLEGRVFSGLPYAIVIDQGRAPGARMPPPAALETWVRRVLQVGGSEKEVRSVAFLVARAIGRKGIKPVHYIDKGLANAQGTLDGIWQVFGEAVASGLVEAGVNAGPGGVGI